MRPVSRASVRTWLLARQPQPPATLAAELAAILEAAPDAAFEAGALSAVLGRLSILTLSDAPPTGDSALVLLASDALVTYAFEAAAEEGKGVTAVAERLLSELRA